MLTTPFDQFADQQTTLLTTFRRDGRPVGTPVHLVVDGDRAYFRTWDATWKFKRLRADPFADIRPCTFNGRATGQPLTVCARLLVGDEARYAGRLLASKYQILHRLIPVFHRLTGKRTVHFELTVAEETSDAVAA